MRTGTKRNGRIAGRINRQIQRVVCGREVVTGTLPHRAHGYICLDFRSTPTFFYAEDRDSSSWRNVGKYSCTRPNNASEQTQCLGTCTDVCGTSFVVLCVLWTVRVCRFSSKNPIWIVSVALLTWHDMTWYTPLCLVNCCWQWPAGFCHMCRGLCINGKIKGAG